MAVVATMLSLAKYMALSMISYVFFIISYRIFFHPLRSFPGPAVAKVSDAYASFFALSRRLHLATFQDQKVYGPVMRHGPNKLVFNSAQALQDIYNNERVTKSHVYELTITAGHPSIFNAVDKYRHRTKRQIVGQAINDKAMRAFEPTMIKQIDIFIDRLREASRSSTPLDMTVYCKRLGMDIVGLLAFGYSLNTQTSAENQVMLSGLTVTTYQQYNHMQFPLLKKLGLHHLLIVIGYAQRVQYLRTLRRMINSRLSQEKHAKIDLYSFVVDHLDLENRADGLTTRELWSEALFFFPAGGDTTSTAISALFFYLSRYPRVYDKLAAEIRNTFKNDAEIRNGPQLAGSKYLRACIDEALRMSPPVGGTPWRELYPQEQQQQRGKQPFIVDGYVVPPGTQVGVCMYSIHHNEEYFPNPFEFRPERWIESDEATLRLMQSAFSPFSIGPRGCAGKSMAYLEASLVIAKTLWQFDFEQAPGEMGKAGAGIPGRRDGRGRADEYQLYDSFGSTHVGPYLVFRSRRDAYDDVSAGIPTRV